MGSNSVGWALLEEKNGKASKIIDLGSRIFNKAVEEKTPTPKNKNRREKRMGRRVIQRRARRRQKMINYLVSLDLLPMELQGNSQPEKCLNQLGDPYELRVKALDEQLLPHQLGRVLLHFAARRGFLSNKKQMAGDLVDDPDTISYLQELDKKPDKDKDESKFKADVARVYQDINKKGARTLGEYLFRLDKGECKRNRAHEGGYLRTDRAMYQEELARIWEKQSSYFSHLPDDFMADNKGVKRIIFYQRPIKLKKDRVGKCSLETKNYRAHRARLEAQRFRYLLDVSNINYSNRYPNESFSLNSEQRIKLIAYLEKHPKITIAALKKVLELDKTMKVNLEGKNIKGNITACQIRSVIGGKWDDFSYIKQKTLVEDLISIKKKSALKRRLINHWNFDTQTAVEMCLLEFEQGHSNHSLKAINKLLPYLKKGMIYSEARKEAGYGYEGEEIDAQETLPLPPETNNPIVNKSLHELRRVVNAVIKKHGKPDAIRIEMARDLEMNTRRVKDAIKRNKENEKLNEEADSVFTEKTGRATASGADRIKYRLWVEQGHRCIYSGVCIKKSQLISNETEVDHIIPKSLCLDNSFTNKVICFTGENRFKGQKTPIEAWGGDEERWNQITQQLEKTYQDLPLKKYRKYVTHPKKKQFYMKQEDIASKYGMSAAQLNDTRYISTVAQRYVKDLGCDVSVTKGAIVSEARYWWGLNSLLGETNQKERSDHRHHAIDAVVIACINRKFHTQAVQIIKKSEQTGQKVHMDAPYHNLRTELGEKLEQIIVSHSPQRKLSGSLHEETGATYIKKHGGLVYRKALNNPKLNHLKIVDETVKLIVLGHISNYKNSKEAFADGITVYHKDGKTPIKRVRVLQSAIKTTKKQNAIDILQQTKFGVKNKQGKIFKWMAYGNTHHVEIIQHKETRKIRGEFVTMMEAHRRAMTGTKSAKKRGVHQERIVKINHGEGWNFLMALHINDTVSVKNETGKAIFYRVQKIDMNNNKFLLRLISASTVKNKNEEIPISINEEDFEKHKIKLHHINSIGYSVND